MASMRGEAEKSYNDKLDRMGLRISTASTGAKAEGHVYPQDDGSQGKAQGGRAKGYESAEANEDTMAGHAAKPRLDRKGFKDGGAVKKGTTVNVIVAPQGGGEPAAPPMMPPPGPPMPPPHAAPPMAPPGGGLPLPGAGGPPAMMRKHGGRVPHIISDGSGGGKGRLQKIKAYGDRAKPGGKAGTM